LWSCWEFHATFMWKFLLFFFYVEKKWHDLHSWTKPSILHSALVDSTKGFSKYSNS
jgi:hypothetical protein